MKNIFLAVFVSLMAGAAVYSQDTTEAKPTQPKTITISEAKPKPAAPPTKTAEKRGPVFRPTKDQIKQAQALLKEKSLYKGEATGTYNDETRDAIRSFQKDGGLKETGTLNRATLEKMNIALTDSQKAIPATDSADEPAKMSTKTETGPSASTEAKPKKPAIFRATKEQIMEAQKTLKAGSMYAGEQTGKLDDATRDGLKKYQEANGLKVTGTLNRITLEKMGIALTDAQKAAAEGQ
jgi:peptidoglycan hydrolase-like protein with peptidoglycan-binding domain